MLQVKNAEPGGPPHKQDKPNAFVHCRPAAGQARPSTQFAIPASLPRAPPEATVPPPGTPPAVPAIPPPPLATIVPPDKALPPVAMCPPALEAEDEPRQLSPKHAKTVMQETLNRGRVTNGMFNIISSKCLTCWRREQDTVASFNACLWPSTCCPQAYSSDSGQINRGQTDVCSRSVVTSTLVLTPPNSNRARTSLQRRATARWFRIYWPRRNRFGSHSPCCTLCRRRSAGRCPRSRRRFRCRLSRRSRKSMAGGVEW